MPVPTQALCNAVTDVGGGSVAMALEDKSCGKEEPADPTASLHTDLFFHGSDAPSAWIVRSPKACLLSVSSSHPDLPPPTSHGKPRPAITLKGSLKLKAAKEAGCKGVLVLGSPGLLLENVVEAARKARAAGRRVEARGWVADRVEESLSDKGERKAL
uniref:Uncharacterized protein n=1 Tax=Hanusia phi TaxID=3032 RepID=A0A7S0E2M5_9CRYP